MARKVRTTKTPEQRRAEAEALHEIIAAEMENLRDSSNWTRFLEFSRHMHRYSLNNVLAVLAQKPDAVAVAGYQTWIERGYQVRRGEKAIRIFGGRAVTTTETDPVTGEETEGRRMRFFPVPVFDISQCDVADPTKAITPFAVKHLSGLDELGIYDATVGYLTEQGWTVTREPIPDGANGYTVVDGSKRIVIEQRISPAMAARVSLHEAAHALMHADLEPGERIAHRGMKETEAESVCFVTAGILGLDTSDYSIGYIAGWSELDLDVIKDTAARVLHISHRLADALTGDPPADVPTDDAQAVAVETLAELENLTAHASASRDPDDLNPASLDPANVGPAGAVTGGMGLEW